MKLLPCLTFLWLPTLAWTPFVYGAETAKSVELRCEAKINPAGIDGTAPRLSWRMESASTGAAQTAESLEATFAQPPAQQPDR